ncbi:ABC transporter substrate-binding protein/permease [Weissella diestrammenae]|uniref:ABC transporter substrate-binding protein/permease n=1 Tax=Weissella diestrammenae TaxID=1162633 RepID=A0A7G9T403_9LACO|nr:ABC transporter substrate-binding protein/permease [Weissella diestrammenae]MCM0583024.1 ABC transporter substrate-binding protein/permease [Weissella diestrammenae]QNN74828.1 ABC transporter substrate-binding protein/permease [Weissella diestrammenae]
MRKWGLHIAVLIAAFLIGFGGLGVPKGHAANKPHYTIVTDSTYPPFEWQMSDGKLVGIDLDMLKAIAKVENFTYELKPMSFNAAVQSVQAGQADGILAGMSITDERKQSFDFGTPYYESGVVVAVANKSQIKNLTQLKNKTVAVKTGTAGYDYAKSIQKQYGFKMVAYNDSSMMYDVVRTGNAVAAFEDQPVMAYAIQQGVDLKIITKPASTAWYGFGVKKGANDALIASFNAGYKKIVASGQYDKIVHRYLGDTGKKYATNLKSGSNKTSWLTIFNENRSAFGHGLWMTLQMTILGIVLASLWGLLLGVMGIAPSRIIRGISTTIIYIFRGLPMLVLAFFIYIGIPNLTGQKVPAFTAGILTLVLNEGAYIGAFVRGGFLSVDKGQLEAARSLGLPYGKAMRKVIMPQGIRLTIPSFVNQFIITLKDTSILSAIGLVELTQTGTLIIARNLQGFKVWLMVGLMYIIVITLLTWLSNWIEKRMK